MSGKKRRDCCGRGIRFLAMTDNTPFDKLRVNGFGFSRWLELRRFGRIVESHYLCARR